MTVCRTYFSTDALCPLNRDPLWQAGHLCTADAQHADAHRCACGATKEPKR